MTKQTAGQQEYMPCEGLPFLPDDAWKTMIPAEERWEIGVGMASPQTPEQARFKAKDCAQYGDFLLFGEDIPLGDVLKGRVLFFNAITGLPLHVCIAWSYFSDVRVLHLLPQCGLEGAPTNIGPLIDRAYTTHLTLVQTLCAGVDIPLHSAGNGTGPHVLH